MATSYTGPLRDEPLAIELHNTRYATSGGPVDAFADPEQARAWLDGIAPRLPDTRDIPGDVVALSDLIALRDAIRAALNSALGDTPPDPSCIETINAASHRAPHSPRTDLRPDGTLGRSIDIHGASRAEVTLAAFARDAIDLLTGPRRADLRACGAPGCVLLFLKHHPRREWCSAACGNRARQARHYQRSRKRPT